MNSDEFEEGLQRHQFRQIPPEWREQVLSKASASRSAISSKPAWRTIIAYLRSQLSVLLWPSPKAWLSLAVIWVLLFIANTSLHETHATTAATTNLPEREKMLVWKQQEELLNELFGPEETHVADRPRRATSSPRSDRQKEFFII